METLTIHIKNKNKAKFLYEILKCFDFVDFPAKEKERVQTSKDTFFNTAGIWETRKITLKSLREKAWKRN